MIWRQNWESEQKEEVIVAHLKEIKQEFISRHFLENKFYFCFLIALLIEWRLWWGFMEGGRGGQETNRGRQRKTENRN
jgi:hypothetical protein